MKEQELLSARIMFFCKKKRMTYYKLASRSAIPLTTLMHIMNGSTKNPGIFTIIKICSGLEITIMKFFDSKEFENIEFEVE